jgi:hypothetical protein
LAPGTHFVQQSSNSPALTAAMLLLLLQRVLMLPSQVPTVLQRNWHEITSTCQALNFELAMHAGVRDDPGTAPAFWCSHNPWWPYKYISIYFSHLVALLSSTWEKSAFLRMRRFVLAVNLSSFCYQLFPGLKVST